MPREKNRKDAAAAEVKVSSLVNAIQSYETQYAALPIGNSSSEEVVTTASRFIDVLAGVDTTNNPKQTAFLEIPSADRSFPNNWPTSFWHVLTATNIFVYLDQLLIRCAKFGDRRSAALFVLKTVLEDD